MIDPISFLIVIVLAVGLSHAVFPAGHWNRLFWIVAPGLLLLFITHPRALGFALACFVFSLGVFVVGRALVSQRLKTRVPYAILLLLFAPNLALLANQQPILWLGGAFFIIRQMMTVAQGIKQADRLDQFIPALLLSTFFFAALPSGPVFNGVRAWDRLRQNAPPTYGEGCYRLFEGFVYLFCDRWFHERGDLGARKCGRQYPIRRFRKVFAASARCQTGRRLRILIYNLLRLLTNGGRYRDAVRVRSPSKLQVFV